MHGRWLCILVVLAGCPGDDSSDDSSDDGGDDGGDECVDTELELPDQILEARTLHANCRYHVAALLEIDAPVIIEAGAVVSFAADASCVIDSTVDGRGGTFTGDTHAPGSWYGVTILAGNQVTLRDLRIEDAGQPTGGNTLDGANVALRINREALPVLDHVTIANSAGHGMELEGDLGAGSTALAFEAIAKSPVYAGARWVGTLPPITVGANVGERRISLDTTGDWGSVGEMTWVPQPVPLAIISGVRIDLASGTLTVEQNVLQFVADGSIRVGSNTSAIGDLITTDVTLEPLPPALSWGGLTITGGYSAATKLTRTTVIGGSGQELDGVSGSLTVSFAAGSCAVPTLEDVTIRTGPLAETAVEFVDDCIDAGCPTPVFPASVEGGSPVHFYIPNGCP